MARSLPASSRFLPFLPCLLLAAFTASLNTFSLLFLLPRRGVRSGEMYPVTCARGSEKSRQMPPAAATSSTALLAGGWCQPQEAAPFTGSLGRGSVSWLGRRKAAPPVYPLLESRVEMRAGLDERRDGVTGCISREELASMLRAYPEDCLPADITEPGKLDEIFDQMDANSDGKVSFEEFKAAMQRDSSLQDVVLSSLRPV
ncbi:hypothetical protein HPP92_017337 [Vanilla planifolia]|uniref:EF-hand domain-containing protein n=1 Tax=Vanilla planifolia TaxID=51239 RepID=A0A835ULU9_VANPL|nr:hypothetical protein HPP92_017337 [Vanilla planifolia]